MYIKSGSQSEYIKRIQFTDIEGNEIGKSLDEILAQIKRRNRKAFDEYLFHKVNNICYNYDDAVIAGSEHAIIVGD